MKKFFAIALAILLTPAAALAQFKEGVHYEVLPTAATKTPEVKEFFSFYCGHCFSFETGQLPKLKSKLGQNVKFEQSHVDFIRGNMGVEATKALLVARLTNVEKDFKKKFFQDIHIQRKPFNSVNDIKALFAEVGVDAKTFDGAYNSFMVDQGLRQMQLAQKQARLTGVPSFVVNGKYKVLNSGAKSWDEIHEIIQYLTTKK
ncbi:thiol:disulfide interchange protein DsbA/DsbL [Paraferrimonas sp. SM1919]|uniref:thiol:disulfide interchange protein DsbA/DsbL n=1 Tax=Paraferrimonas sp. SM1919 TaxID=2662263 RepID=UPI0013D06626|nr:thiol:disulfide interchange protein DsbA/DsbL [Paraferrimonas sp. SM1919]